ncbi:MAG: hypothetical protein Q8L55_06215 [Phycisphaerales bacterium]|nr:hypothetical protein [Phycisphaerales bacterium]
MALTTASRNLSLVCITLSALAGCATSPEYITPLAVSEAGYMAFDCDQLAQQQASLGKQLTEFSELQRSARSGDTFGVILIGLPMSTITGSNVSDKIAKLKGEIQALQKAADAKNCNLTPIDVLPPKPSPSSGTDFQ